LRSLPYLKSGDESTQLSVADKLQGFAGGLEKGQRRDTMAGIDKGPLTSICQAADEAQDLIVCIDLQGE